MKITVIFPLEGVEPQGFLFLNARLLDEMPALHSGDTITFSSSLRFGRENSLVVSGVILTSRVDTLHKINGQVAEVDGANVYYMHSREVETGIPLITSDFVVLPLNDHPS